MGTCFSANDVWDIEPALLRMGEGHYTRFRDTYRKVAVLANATAGMTFEALYRRPALDVLSDVLGHLARPAMVSEKLLSKGEQGACLGALDQVLRAIEALPDPVTLHDLSTRPGDDFPTLIPLFRELDSVSPRICVPFVQPGFDPALAKACLDELLALIGPTYTLADLYERSPAPAIKSNFNRVMVRAKRAGLLIDLVGICKPAAPGYVSDPADDRWDVRSCVPPENAFLFKDVHVKINTMAFLMAGLNYGDFFDLPMTNPKVLPHFRARVLADRDYWFTPLERDRIVAALDQILDALRDPASSALSFREVYSDPGIPPEVLVPFQRILDVKPEICLPFMLHDFDHAAAADAIDVFLERYGHLDLKGLYTAPPEPEGSPASRADLATRIRQHEAKLTLMKKVNNLICIAPGQCIGMLDEYCNTAPLGNCPP
ncbi:MAG: hypothetical protein JNK74_21345 [Candidatus Hydrogenedentes bacterium]|nr:hypothetical protein [Candidatus Hydrogenedentota bacterium]